MIQDVKCFTAKCDGCGEIYCDEHREGFTIFSDEGALTEAMQGDSWHHSFDENNKSYCPNCHEINDDDELVLKGRALETKS